MDHESGIVDLVGAGPGDPGLITRSGMEALARADVVVYDHLVHARLLELAPRSAERIFAGKQAGRCVLKQPEINELLVRLARAGKRVVRLKGGDPFVFGRGAEEAEHLTASGVRFRVVPGVTAAVGVSAYAGVPITHRGAASAVTFVTGHDEPDSPASRLDWQSLARCPGTIVIYMGVGRLKSLCDALLQGGKSPDTPAVLIQNGTLAHQRTIEAPLAELAQKSVDRDSRGPGLVVIGDVVNRRVSLKWFESQPLFGQRILVTRPLEESERSARDLELLGAEAIVAPMVEIRPLDDFELLDQALDRLREFDWLVFTSPNGVRFFFDRLEQRGRDLRALGHLRLAAIGPTTQNALKQLHLTADVVPPTFRSEALAEALADQVVGRRILFARADRGREVAPAELARIADVEQVAVYRNVDAISLPPEVAARIADGSIDWITLTSPAIAERLFSLWAGRSQVPMSPTIQFASLSPLTTATASKLGWPIAVEAEEATWTSLIEALAAAVAAQRNSR
jgi:uroporphyrinogen III methyltransferase / synthase